MASFGDILSQIGTSLQKADSNPQIPSVMPMSGQQPFQPQGQQSQPYAPIPQQQNTPPVTGMDFIHQLLSHILGQGASSAPGNYLGKIQ